MGLPELLIRLLVGVLVFFLGEKVIGLVKNPDMQQLLTVVLVIVVVLYVVFGSFVPFR